MFPVPPRRLVNLHNKMSEIDKKMTIWFANLANVILIRHQAGRENVGFVLQVTLLATEDHLSVIRCIMAAAGPC